jgi:uncharacterized protein with PIN domain
MIYFLIFTTGFALFLFGIAWWAAYHSELGKDILEHKFRYKRCPMCNEIILKDSHTNNGEVHEWCEGYF